MRRLVATALALTLAAGLAACGKSSSQGGQNASGGTSAPQEAAAPPPTMDQMKALQANLPAPYNTADLTNGQSKFAFCAACHTIAPGGPNMTGPNLHGVVGRKAGTAPNYNYSDAVKAAGFTWDAAHLDTWLSSPRAMLPGTKMTFPGLKDPKDRADVIAYLMVNSASKAP